MFIFFLWGGWIQVAEYFQVKINMDDNKVGKLLKGKVTREEEIFCEIS